MPIKMCNEGYNGVGKQTSILGKYSTLTSERKLSVQKLAEWVMNEWEKEGQKWQRSHNHLLLEQSGKPGRVCMSWEVWEGEAGEVHSIPWPVVGAWHLNLHQQVWIRGSGKTFAVHSLPVSLPSLSLTENFIAASVWYTRRSQGRAE